MIATIERLANDVLESAYFLKLYEKLAYNQAKLAFLEEGIEEFNDKELRDILRFSDILSNSRDERKRNLAYRIIALLKDNYEESQVYIIYANAILKKLGHFPCLNKIAKSDILPIERKIEFDFKKKIQKISEEEEMYFTDGQYALFEKLDRSMQVTFSGPTSMGKSFVIKQYVKKILRYQKNICIIVPTRALIKQYVVDFSKEMSEDIKINNYSVISNVNVVDMMNGKDKKKRFIYVLTPERLINFLTKRDKENIGYLFVDEAHKLIEYSSRGLTYFTAIDMCLKKFKQIRVYMSSPLIDNPELLLDIFEKRTDESIVVTKESPVTQNIYYLVSD